MSRSKTLFHGGFETCQLFSSHAPSILRSSGVIRVMLPGGIA